LPPLLPEMELELPPLARYEASGAEESVPRALEKGEAAFAGRDVLRAGDAAGFARAAAPLCDMLDASHFS
jgi:hypothetical protein